MLTASDSGLRRVCVHGGEIAADLALPAAVPVATLIPSIIDILNSRGAEQFPTARYQLCRPGMSALPASTTLAQNDIRDGTVLVLYQCAADVPSPIWDDPAEAVWQALETAAPASNRRAARLAGAAAAGCITATGCLTLVRNALRHNAPGAPAVAALACLAALAAAMFAHRGYRDTAAGLTLSGMAIAFAAVAGLLAVPGPPGAAQVLLAAMTATVASVLATRVIGSGVVILTAVSCFAVAVAVAALAAVLTAAPLHVIGSVSALVSLALLETSARLSLTLGGLSRQLSLTIGQIESDADRLTSKAARADVWLTSLLAAFSASAATGAVVGALAARGASRLGCIALAALTAAVLLLRTLHDRRNTVVFVVSGIGTAAATFAIAALSAPARGAWIAGVTALAAAASIYLGFVAPARPLAPVARRGIEVLECLVLAAMVPLTCWVCGLYSAVRSMDLG